MPREMSQCELIQGELVAYHFGEIEPERRGEVEAHLLRCRVCLGEFITLKREIETCEQQARDDEREPGRQEERDDEREPGRQDGRAEERVDRRGRDPKAPSELARARLRRAVMARVAPESLPRRWSWWERPAAVAVAAAAVFLSVFLWHQIATTPGTMPRSLQDAPPTIELAP